MKKLRKRIFAAVLAAFMIVTAMPVTALYASAETGSVSGNAAGQAGTDDTEETGDGDTEETETDDAEETGDSGTEEPAQEPPAGPLEEDTAKCICETLCTEDNGSNSGSINGDCPVCGAEGADLSACTGKEQGSAPEKDTVDDNAGTDTAECICETLCTEDSINGDCPVCGAEDADLSRCKGEKTEEQEKTGEKVITAWEWIDPEEYLTDGMLALPGSGRENPAFVEDVTALLPEKIQAKVAAVNAAEDGEETEEDAEITLTGWKCASYPEDGAYEGTYTFTASLPEGFVLAEDAVALEVKVELGGAKMLAETVSVSYQEASWNDGVTYTTKTADSCTPVADSAEAVEWAAGWYVVNSTVTISEPITVTGAVNLILGDGCTLNAEKGIVVETGNSLTIYAQSGGTGTLTVTGTTDSDHNASAGIGGSIASVDSGTITIHGGVINATGGGQSGYYGAAGIGGGTSRSGNGGNSGTIIIYGGTVTANSGEGGLTGAGIGGGGGEEGGTSSNITIYGGSVTAASIDTSTGGAGIGGGADSAGTSGNGTVTISGGTVTAVGGQYAAGIGGGGGYYYSNNYGSGGCTGGTGSVTISGGIVDASSPTEVAWEGYEGAPIGNGGNTTATATVEKTTGIVFENGAGTVYGDVTLNGSYEVPAGYSLHIPAGASLSGSGTLSGGSAFTTENLRLDMISVPTDLYYTGEDRSADITTRLSDELTKGVTICGQTFAVSGWTLAVEKTDDLTYTATYTNNNDNTNTFTKTITLLKSGTKFEGDVKTYNGDTQTTTFNADDTITVKATPTATGTAPAKAAVRLRGSYTAPTAGQMALFVGDVQVSAPVEAGTDGTYTMEVSAAEVLLQGNAEQNGNAITLTAKFVGNDNMADAAGTVDVRISAVAMAEKDGEVIDYFGVSNFEGKNNLFCQNDYADATITLLGDVKPGTNSDAGTTCSTMVNITCTLDLAGHNFTSTDTAIYVLPMGNLTIQDSSTGKTGNVSFIKSDGTLTLYGGTFGKIETAYTLASLLAENCAYYRGSTPILLSELEGQKTLDGTVTVQECQHTGVEVKDLGSGKHGLDCPYCGYHSEHTTTLTATVSGNTVTFRGGCESCDYRAETLATAAFTIPKLTYGQTDQTVSCTWEHPNGYALMVQIDSGEELQLESSDTQVSLPLKQLFGSQEINAGNYQLHVYCRSYADVTSNVCSLPVTVDPAPLPEVTLSAESATYSGTEQKPALSVQQGETALTEGTDYEVSYTRDGVVTTDFTNAGTVNITVTGKGNYTGSVEKTYTIGKATPTIAWANNVVTLTYTGQPADIKPVVTLVNGETFSGTITYHHTNTDSSESGESKAGLPTNAGIYVVGARIPEQDNYTAAATAFLMLTINKADQTVPAAPTAAEDNIKDNSITLDAIENAEYKRDDGEWQENPTFTGLEPNQAYTFYVRLKADRNHNASPSSAGTSITTRKAMLENASVTITGTYTYTGAAIVPEAGNVEVVLNGTKIDSDQYTISASNNINAGVGKATLTVTATETGNYSGSVSSTFTISKATLYVAPNSQIIRYGESIREGASAILTRELATGDHVVGVTLTPNTRDVPGGKIIASEVQIQNESGADVTGNYEITYVPGNLTINPAQGTLTVPAGPVTKTFGDGQFLLGCSTNGDGKISYASSDENVASVSADGNVLIKGAGEAVITVSLADGTNYTGAESQEVRITVAKAAAPAIPGETRNYTYLNGSHGAVTIDVAGKLPKDRGETTYTAAVTDGKGILSGVSIDQDGNLVYTVEANKAAGDTAVITVTAVMANYGDTAYAVTIGLVEKKTVEPQDGGSVSVKDGCILTYGQTLSDLTLETVIFVEQGTQKQVEGTLAWSNPSHVPEVADRTAQWVFTPKDNKEYEQFTGTAAITVVKATPETEAPEAAAVTYHPAGTLDSVGLNGGGAAWTVGGSAVTVEGTWGWKEPSAIPAVKNSGYTAVFTPKDTANYDTVERTVAVTVAKAEPYIATPPTAAQITYGDALDASALTGGTVQYSSSDGTAVTGSFAWKDGSIKPDSGSAAYTVVFTPADSTDYSSVETQVTLVTGKAENAPDMPPSAMNVARRFEKVGDVGLPEGWQWQDTDRDTALEIGVPVTATAVYTGADRDNYRNVTVSVTITRADCDHEHTETRNAVTATCQRKGYTGDTWCLDCGELLAKGTETDLADHSGGTATCIRGKVCQVCGTEYTGKDSANHMHTEIRGAIKAGCTSDGYTGDTYCTDCGAKTGSGRAVPAAGHDWHVTREEAATTTSEGRRIYTCSKCGQTREESIPKLPQPSHTHSYSPRETKAATCTENGVVTYSCSCGDSYTQNTAALGHSYRSEVTKQPTATSEGVMTYTCDRCGHSYTRPIAKLPGEGTTDPGTSQPGDTEPGSGSTETRPDTGIPFIKGGDGRTGWDVIRAEEEQAQDGSIINVDMNGTTVVPGDIFDSIRGRDITVTFDMGGGILWSVNGKEVITDKAGDIDFSVKTETNAIPVDIVNNVTGERYSIQISLAHEGEFGFTAVLSIGLGRENAGYTASLYYYNENTGELEFICSDEVAEDGTVSLAFTHASDYVIAIDGEEESGNATEPEQPDTPDKDSTGEAESPKTGQAWRPWWFIVVGALVIVMGIGVFLAVRKKQETENS